ncbi:MAG: hypothetical protein ACI8XQ_000896, partial [Bermanella sp.]
ESNAFDGSLVPATLALSETGTKASLAMLLVVALTNRLIFGAICANMP